MLKYNDDYEAYVFESDDMMICWNEYPGDNYEENARALKTAYNRNITHIAECIYDELKDVLDFASVDEVASKLGKPQINPDIGQVIYCENRFDGSHIISFEYYDEEFEDIEFVAIDG